MDTTTLVVIIAAAIVAVIVIAAILWKLTSGRREHTGELKQTFGTEYDRVSEHTNGRDEAEAELERRIKRVRSYDLRVLSADERRGYIERWRLVQAEFVDQPSVAVTAADALLVEVMAARGYESASADPETRADDVSVGHGDEAEDYREARAIAARNRHGDASTDDLREAMMHFRRVFDALLEPTPAR